MKQHLEVNGETMISRSQTRCAATACAFVVVTAAVTALPSVARAQTTQVPSVKITRQTKSFANCKAAGKFLDSGAEAGHASVMWIHTFTKPAVTDTGGDFWKATAKATSTYLPKKSSIRLVVPNWPHMSSADKASIKHFEDALLAHEEGHQKLAQDILVHFTNYPLAGAGQGSQAAVADLDKEEAKYKKNLDAYIQEREDAYDAKTDHGRHQSADGGVDVVLTCH
ncbi:DUF922 domain-containing protein [Actinoallomurus sp. NPDC050550]|uniref:DUF922 domain-containing protein n=1 Tax=Actinoallomurus sp. NPDC050550 TaxID=3154937 RepID=UPI0033DE4269